VRFFFDNCISVNLTDAMGLLTAPYHDIEHLTTRFSPDALDVEWIPVVARDTDIVLVSGDPAITTSKKEKEIWRQSRLTSFFFGGDFAQLPIWSQVTEVVNWWPQIVLTAKSEPPRGTGYLLPLKGSKKAPKLIYEPVK